MNKNPFGILPVVEQPWGFDGVRREMRGAYGDSRAFYVNPNHLECNDLNTGEDPAHPLVTIQRAVTLCRAYMGDVIYVMSNDGWQYGSATQLSIAETVVIPATKPGISLIGIGRGSMGAYWRPALTTEFALTIRAIDVVVDGFCFWGAALVAANGINVIWGAPTNYGENTVIRNCTFTDDLTIGIQMEYVWFAKIYDCLFQELGTGIYGDPAGTGSAYLEIFNNAFHDCTVGAILMTELTKSYIHGNRIFNARAQAGAAATGEGVDTSGGGGNLVSDNYFSCLLPVPAVGDYDDLNSGDVTDAWINNHCLNGDTVGNPT